MFYMQLTQVVNLPAAASNVLTLTDTLTWYDIINQTKTFTAPLNIIAV